MLERLNNDMINAMRNHDKITLDVIRMTKGAIQLEEISKKRPLEEDEIMTIIGKQVKLRRESIVEFEKGNRQDLIAKTMMEIDILNSYLPEQLSDNELLKIIDEVITKVGATTITDLGSIMKELAPLIKGKADMGKVNHIIRTKLSN